MFHRLNGKMRCFRFQNATDTTIHLPIPILSSTLPTSSLFNDYYFLRYICLCKDPNRLYIYILLTDSLSIYYASMLIYNLILIIRRQYLFFIYIYMYTILFGVKPVNQTLIVAWFGLNEEKSEMSFSAASLSAISTSLFGTFSVFYILL